MAVPDHSLWHTRVWLTVVPPVPNVKSWVAENVPVTEYASTSVMCVVPLKVPSGWTVPKKEPLSFWQLPSSQENVPCPETVPMGVTVVMSQR